MSETESESERRIESVKIFQAFGHDQIARLEREIDNWLWANRENVVIKTDLALASAGDPADLGQALVLMVWYAAR